MSIIIPLDELTDDKRVRILNELQVEMPKTRQYVFPYLVEDPYISIPFHYALSLGYTPKPRNDFPKTSYSFQGELRDYQKEVKKETLQELKKKCSTVLSLHVGWGKSVFAVYLAHKLQFKTLIVVNRLVLVKQWRELIHSLCPDATTQLVKTKDELDPNADFYLMNAINATKKAFGFFDTIGTVIVDELHLICAKTLYKCFYYISPRYLIGLSATPYRPDGLDKLIDFYFGEHRITKALYREHTVYCIHTGLDIPYDYNWEGRIDWNSLLNNQAMNEDRNLMIVRILQHFKDRYFLVLCKRIAQGERLIELLEERKESVTDLLGVKKEFDTEARIVIATTSKVGVGFSHNKLNALVMASDVEEYFIQYLGRVFRTPEVQPIVFDLVDKNSVLKKHLTTRRKVYKEAGGILKTIKCINDLLK